MLMKQGEGQWYIKRAHHLCLPAPYPLFSTRIQLGTLPSKGGPQNTCFVRAIGPLLRPLPRIPGQLSCDEIKSNRMHWTPLRISKLPVEMPISAEARARAPLNLRVLLEMPTSNDARAPLNPRVLGRDADIKRRPPIATAI